MKNKTTFLILGFLLFIGSIQAQVAVKFNVATAGTLSTLINSIEKNQIISLTLTGDLNGDDIRFIREMAGRDVNGYSTSGNLSVLDLSGAGISRGGGYYFSENDFKFYTTAFSISDNMFRGCDKLTSVTLPRSVTSLGNYAFYCCAGLKSVTIPDSLTSIRDFAFSGCRGLNSVTLPDSLTDIGYHAFSECTGLTSVTIPDSVTFIGNNAFSYCTGLTSVIIPGSVTSLGAYAFFGCTGLTRIVVDSSNTQYSSLDGVLFNKNSTLLITCPNGKSGQYTIPGSVTSIGYYAFRGCTGLTSVTIPGSVTSIVGGAFDGCTGLTSVTIPGSVTSINGDVFNNCTGLTSVIISNGVTSIGYTAFAGCTGLTSVSIPGSVTSIVNNSFQNCTELTRIVVDSSNSRFSSIDGVLFDKTKTTLITCPEGKAGQYTIPDRVISIEVSAFSGCKGLTSVIIPNGVTSIGIYAFKGCTGLATVTIPNSVNFIGQGAFENCTGLTEIHCQMKTPPTITGEVFYNVNKNICILYVPIGSSQLYRDTNKWKDFTNIVEESITPINELSLSKASVSTLHNSIIIQNAHGETISVYTPSGALLKTVKASDDYIKIEVPENQIYLVKIANITYKVALK